MANKDAQNTMTQSDTPKSSTESVSRSNVPEFSVGDLAFSLKKTLEDNFGRVRVRGELSRVSIAGSGHMYSSLKDENAVIDAVCWKGVMSKLTIKPEEGLEVICTGRISTFPQRSNYQLIIESMELAGEGALLKMLEDRRKKLAAEGLFDVNRKKKIPFIPHTIGIITSPTGAVIRDILHRLNDRFPRNVMLWPVLVQGENAANQVATAIRGFQNIDQNGLAKPDLLIVARGGGSLEDLMPFNDEDVVRAISESAIPIISAIGHETDTTLSDFAADLRAPTPTGAAEMAVPVRSELITQILGLEQRLISSCARALNDRRNKLDAANARLGDPSRILQAQSQRLDHLNDKLRAAFSKFIDVKQRPFIACAAGLRAPQNRVTEAQKTLNRIDQQLNTLGIKLTDTRTQTIKHLGKMLEAYSFKNTLKRGYSVVRDQNGTLVTNSAILNTGDIIDIEFAQNNHVKAAIGDKAQKTKIPPKKPSSKKTNPPVDQGSLF